MVYNMQKPSKNMMLNQFQLSQLIREQEEERERKEQEKKDAEELEAKQQECDNNIQKENYIRNSTKYQHDKVEFLQNVKNALVAECVYKLYKDSMLTPMTSRDETVARNLVNKFVLEHGAGNLMIRFADQTKELAEFSYLCNKYYKAVVESLMPDEDEVKAGKVKELNLDTQIKDDFFKDLEDVDTEDASKLIRDRVSDTMTDFVDTNINNKLEYEDVIQQAQDKAAVTKDEEIAEAYINRAKGRILEMRSKQRKKPFTVIVESLTAAALTDPELKQRYVNEATVDMDGIVESAQLIYTMLEMVNTTHMCNVDAQFVQEFLDSLNSPS